MNIIKGLNIKKIENKEIWEDFLLGCQEKTFLDSWNWGEFNKAIKNKIWRLGVYENANLIAVALVVRIVARRGTFLFIPHGPVVKSKVRRQKLKVLEALLERLREIAREENCSFIRIAPIWERGGENKGIFKKFGFRVAPLHIHPETTWELDITPDLEGLLMGMRKTTRYLIRKEERDKDITIEKSRNIKDIEIFNKLYYETARRHHFVPFSLSYLRNEFLPFISDNEILIFIGKYRGEIVSSAVIIFWQEIAFYHQGASLSQRSKLPVSYLLQWEVIKEAQKRGCRIYNFWGIMDTKSKVPLSSGLRRAGPSATLRPPDTLTRVMRARTALRAGKRHPWYGLTLFKMGFGGFRKDYVKTQDFPLSKKYWLIFIFEALRKKKRGL